MSDPSFLPYGRQSIDEADIAAVAEVLRGAFLTTGPMVDRFEAALSQSCGGVKAIACNSGTSALFIASRALGIGEGDVAIVPATTFLATASAPFLCGADIVFADVDPETGLMRPDDLATAISAARARFPDRRLAAAFVVHLNGQCADMPGLRALCDAEGLALIEDACHALGGEARDGVPVGDTRWSDAACFSFHPVKAIATGEGGAVTTRDEAVAERLRLHRNHGMTRDPQAWTQKAQAFDASGDPNPWYYELTEPGLNFRIPDILCALGISQLDKLAGWVAEREALHARYTERLRALNSAILAPPARVSWGRPAWHLCVARIDFEAAGRSRAQVMTGLRDRWRVGTQVHYIPLHWQPFWRDRYGETALPGAETYYARALSLPLFVGMTEADVDRVVDALRHEAGLV